VPMAFILEGIELNVLLGILRELSGLCV
jgi:hypothetical protein